jgi:hypothetical protein
LAKRRRAEEKDLVAAEDAQVYLGVSRATFWNLVRRYGVPKYRIPIRGKRVFFKRSDLDRLREPIRVDQKAHD